MPNCCRYFFVTRCPFLFFSGSDSKGLGLTVQSGVDLQIIWYFLNFEYDSSSVTSFSILLSICL